MQRDDSNIDLPLAPRNPKKPRRGAIIAGAVVLVLIGLFIGQASGGNSSDAAAAPAPAPSTVTITAPPTTAYPYPTETQTPDPQPVVQVNPNAKACGTLKRAATLPAFSSRWDSVMYDAEDQAKTDPFYKAIYHAENELWGPGYTYEHDATVDVQNALKKFC